MNSFSTMASLLFVQHEFCSRHWINLISARDEFNSWKECTIKHSFRKIKRINKEYFVFTKNMVQKYGAPKINQSFAPKS
jgi:hypothetical protein